MLSSKVLAMHDDSMKKMGKGASGIVLGSASGSSIRFGKGGTIMGAFSDKRIADYYGISIAVEGSAKLMGGSFRLYVDNEKRDDVELTLGTRTLRSKLAREGRDVPVEVECKAGMFGTSYKLIVDGKEHPLQKIR